jgi:TolB-like protein
VAAESSARESGNVSLQLAKILASRFFVNSHRLSRFLRFITEKAGQGSVEQLKEFIIGVEVFDRSPVSYNPATDPIVRVQARRLREKLAEYYRDVGLADPVIVNLPLGGYVPNFKLRPEPPAPAGMGSQNGSELRIDSKSASALAVLPFLGISSDSDIECFSEGLTEELTFWLSRVANVKITARTSTLPFKRRPRDVRHIGMTLGVLRVIEGSVRKAGPRLRVTARLISAENGCHIWMGQFDRTCTDTFRAQTEISRSIRRAVRPLLKDQDTPVAQ